MWVTRTKASPLLEGMLVKNRSKASNAPAEPPMPTMKDGRSDRRRSALRLLSVLTAEEVFGVCFDAVFRFTVLNS